MIEKLKHDGDGFVDENDCFHETKADYIQSQIIGLCDCGNPDEVMRYVGEMLAKLDRQEFGNYKDMPYMFFVYWANHNKFASHGTSARCSFLTDLGKELLRDIREVQ